MKVTRYKLFPTQRKFLFGFSKDLVNRDEIYYDISLYQGGVGSGKTFIGSLRGLYYALKWPGCRGLVGAMSQDLLDNTTKRKYLEHMANIGLKEDVHWWYKDRKQTIVLKNGSEIRFKTLSDWRQFMSEEFTWIEFEEASFLEQIVFDKLITRLRQMKKDVWEDFHYSLFLHTNPQGKRGWLNKLFINPKTRIKGYRYVIASTRENTYLGKSYVETMENLYSKEQIDEMIEGLDLDYDNTIAFPQFLEDNIIENIKIRKDLPLVLTCDFNYNPMCWYLMQEYDGKWYILKELINQSVTTLEMCKLIQPIIDEIGIRSLLIMGDSHGRDKKTNGSDYSVIISYFGQLGYDITMKVQKANPLIKERLATLRGVIRNAKGEVRLYVDSSCKKLLYNFEECKNQLANGGIKIPTDSEIQSDPNKLFLVHPIDAISYPIWFLHSLRAMAGEGEQL